MYCLSNPSSILPRDDHPSIPSKQVQLFAEPTSFSCVLATCSIEARIQTNVHATTVFNPATKTVHPANMLTKSPSPIANNAAMMIRDTLKSTRVRLCRSSMNPSSKSPLTKSQIRNLICLKKDTIGSKGFRSCSGNNLARTGLILVFCGTCKYGYTVPMLG